MRDSHGRQVDYMRVSVTDRCNERCSYCMPEDHSDWLPKGAILTYEEILTVARVAAGMGFRRFRVTGGEPLVRRGVEGFVERLCAVPGVEKVTMTTNGTRLAGVARRLREGGMWGVNISLDSLDATTYGRVTRGRLRDVLEGIEGALEAGFHGGVKLNVVLMKGVNEGELWKIVEYAAQKGIAAVRFIELMPVSDGDVTDSSRFLSISSAMEILRGHDELTPLPDTRLGAGPAKYWRLEMTGMRVGFIGAMTDEHFCEQCNKVRLTADGFIRPCLGQHGEHDLKPALRGLVPFVAKRPEREVWRLPNFTETVRSERSEASAQRWQKEPVPLSHSCDAAVAQVLRRSLAEKPLEHLFRENYTPLRIMTAIGG